MYVITGGGSGIGKALAIHLAKVNKKVLLVGRREHLLKETVEHTSNIQYVCADVGKPSGREKVAAFIGGQKIEALVNNAAILEPMEPIMKVSSSDWQKMMSINVDAPLFLSQLLQPLLSNGKVLNIGSGAAFISVPALGPYCVSKAALYRLTHCCAIENQEIAFAWATPGISDTHMQKLIRECDNLSNENQHFYQQLKQKDLLVSPETVAAFFAWLLLDVPAKEYSAKDWDIYDTSHHDRWLKAPYVVPVWSQ